MSEPRPKFINRVHIVMTGNDAKPIAEAAASLGVTPAHLARALLVVIGRDDAFNAVLDGDHPSKICPGSVLPGHSPSRRKILEMIVRAGPGGLQMSIEAFGEAVGIKGPSAHRHLGILTGDGLIRMAAPVVRRGRGRNLAACWVATDAGRDQVRGNL